MSFSKIYLDSNVLISALGRDDSVEAAELLVDIIAAFSGEPPAPFTTSELSLAETLVRPLREQKQDDIDEIEALLVTRDWLAVEPVSRDVLLGNALLRSQYSEIKLPDAIHISTALISDCSHLLTADRKIRGSYGGTSPGEKYWAEDRVTEVIRPDVQTLRTILSWLSA